MKDVLLEEVPTENLGPAMLAINERQRKFVVGWIRAGGKNATRILKQAGFNLKPGADRVHAHWLLHNAKVRAALREEFERDLNGPMAVMAGMRLNELAKDEDPKIRMKAVDSILDRSGFARQTNQQISMQVEHVDTRSTAEIMAELRKLLGEKTDEVIEGAFKEIEHVG